MVLHKNLNTFMRNMPGIFSLGEIKNAENAQKNKSQCIIYYRHNGTQQKSTL
uniref:Uncharacterized protein n=1 Tax=viral metagenome TaxID=1070528 RepID=A0A6C0LCP0_9ZZZZ